MAYTQLSLDTFICVIGITIFVTCQFDVHCSIFKGRISENCPPPLEQIDPSNSSFIYPRPDVMLEGKYSGHEDIYGEKCFWIYLRGVVQHFTVHLSIMRKHNPFCSNLTVNGVELIAYGYIKQNQRHLRIPVGKWDRLYQDGTSCFLTGSVNLSPNHIKIPGAPKLHSHPECHKTPGPLNTIESNSYRMVKHHGNDGTPLSLPDSVGVIACAKWLYDPKDLLYPYEMWKAKKLHLDFVAEIELELNGDKMYRYIGKRSEFNKPIIGPLPKIACQRPTTTTARTTTTTAKSTISTTSKSTRPTTFKPPRSTTRRTTSLETTITEITTDITTTLSPYIRCKTPDCNIVRKNLHDSTAELFTSFYESIMDTCMCFERDMKNNFTDKKYTFGGLHYGLPIPESQLAPTDPLFNDCLQFYFDPETRCLIFILEECNVAQIESFVLEEFHMLALGSRDSVFSSAFPFGRFELVDSLGNCGNLINDKAPKPRRALRLPNKSEACPQRSYSFIDFGMIPGKGPIFERLKPYPSLVLQGNSSRGVNIVKPLVYALRFSTDYNFGRVIPTKRMRYINFALQIVSLLNLKNTPPQRKYQSISMKTPIMDINYNESDPTDTDVFITDIRRKTNQTHELSYFQLHEDVHDELFYRGNSCPVVMRKYPKPIVVVKAHEETCYCFSSPRSPSPDTPPMQLSEFLEDVVTQTPYPLPISEDCFIISFNKSPKDLCHTDPDFRVARVMFSFGLTCAGEEGLEIRDMIVQANNRMGYPVGSWTAIDVDSSGLGVKCAEQLKEHDPNVALGKQWTIREVKHVYQFHCPDVDIGSHSSIEDARMETFLQRERPHMLFYNHNLTLHAINNDKNFGFCAWWEFHSPEQYIHGHPEDFYFDFQFVVTANINHIPSGKNYVVAFRGPKAGFNMKTCDVDNIDDPKEVLMDKNYYNEKVNEHKQLCIEVLVYRDRFEDGLCGCFIGTYEHNSGPSFNTHRIQISEYNETDPIKEEIEILQQCLQVQMLPGRRHNNYEIYVNYKLKNAAPCIKDHWFYEVVFQVINNNGLPMGNWDAELVTGGTGCKTANELGEAEISLHKCHQSRVHAENGLYKAPSDNVDVLHFKNRWKDEHFQDLCVRWKYPREYANINKGDPTKFPANLQIYVQAQVYRKSSKRFLTSPTFSSKKMKFTEAGTFDTRSLISKLPIEHENDYLNFLATDFDQGPINYCIPYPQPPEYASSTCRMFHATPHPMKHSVRDLDNPKDLLALPYIRDNCFSFNAYPGNEPLSMHLNFRQEKTNGNCDVEKGIHFAVTAYNELGFPIGRIYPGKGLTHYNHPRVPSNDRRFCGAEDIAVTEETILPVDDESCPFFGDDSRNLTFSTIKEFYKQEASVDQLPNMIGFGTDPRAPPRGICFHWIYDSQKAPQSTPEFIQFYFEFFVPFDEENLNDGKHYVMRSKKFQMNYTAGNTIPPVPNPVKKCHDEATSQGSFFEPLPIPTEFWSQWHDYNIYPDKMLYRRCLEEYRVFGTCKTSLKGKPLLPVINPIVIVPGGDGDNNEDYKYRHYNSTKVIYDGCIASKLCFAPISDSRKADPSSDCIVDMTCEMVWALGKQPIRRQDAYLPTPEDDEIVVEIYAVSTSWIAIALSKDFEMGDDLVFECIKEGGFVNLYTSWNYIDEGYKDNQRLPPDENVRLVLTKANNHSMYCMFYLKTYYAVTNPRSFVDLQYDLINDAFCILNAYGEKLKIVDSISLGVGNHLEGNIKGMAGCGEHVQLTTRLTVSVLLENNMPTRRQIEWLQYHGIFMTIAYIALYCPSMFIARYYKTSLTNVIRDVQIWAWVHAVLSSIGTFFVIIGWILVYPGISGWDSQLSVPFHKYIGVLSMFLIFANTIVGYSIRKTDLYHLRSRYTYMFHGIGGHFAVVSGLFIIMWATQVEYAFVSCETGTTAGIWVGIYFVIHIIMSFNRLWIEKLVGANKVNGFFTNPWTVLLTQKHQSFSWNFEDPNASRIRKVIFILFALIAWAFALTIVIQIAVSEYSCLLEASQEGLSNGI